MAMKELDVERAAAQDSSYLNNHVVKCLSWSDIDVIVKDRATQTPKKILDNVSGQAVAGKTSLAIRKHGNSLIFK